MYLYIVNYSERGPSGHQLILRQSSLWYEHFEDFYIPTIMRRGLTTDFSDSEAPIKKAVLHRAVFKICNSLARVFSSQFSL